MAGFIPVIDEAAEQKTWMAVTSTAMTNRGGGSASSHPALFKRERDACGKVRYTSSFRSENICSLRQSDDRFLARQPG